MDDTDTHIVFLGTAGGPSLVRGRAGISTAVVVRGNVYLIDAGYGLVRRYVDAGLPLDRLRAVLITHLHGDHIAELFNLFLFGARTVAEELAGIDGPVDVIGPGPAPGAGRPPAAGVQDFFDRSHDAFAATLHNWRKVKRDPRELARIREIEVSREVREAAGHGAAVPAVEPFVVLEAEDVRISATVVPHMPYSFAYRIDTDQGSVVLSGDTGVSQNVVSLATCADVLVHEVAEVDEIVRLGLPDSLRETFTTGTHTSVTEVGRIAAAAGVDTLALNHFVPAGRDRVSLEWWERQAQNGYDGRVIVAEDRDTLRVET